MASLKENDRFMVRREGEKRRVLGMACSVRVPTGGETRKIDIKEGKSLMGGVTLVTKSVIIVRRRDAYK